MKIYVHFLGGLGNQIFQYAAARYYQEKYKADSVIIEISNYEKYKLRKLELSHYQLHKSCSFTDNVNIMQKGIYFSYRVYQKLISVLFKKFAKPVNFKVGFSSYYCTSIYALEDIEVTDTIFLYGYFVSNRIASSMRNILMQELIPTFEETYRYAEYLRLIQKVNSIGVSIRCDDDYVSNGWPIGTKEFYNSGIKMIKEKYPDAWIFIFADRIDKVKDKQWFAKWDVIYIENTTVTESFELLRHCKHYVISNSTFSWWGAFLTYNIGGESICMNRFFNEKFEGADILTRREGVIYLNYQTGKYE